MIEPRLAVLGRPIEHSRSPEIHEQFAAQCGFSLSYEKILVAEGEFDHAATEFLKSGIGFNVTVPCKHEAWQFVDESSRAADIARAVNTVSINDGKTSGANTDGEGLVADIVHNLGWDIEGKGLLVLGAGGAVSGVLSSLLDENPAAIHLYNRTAEKAAVLANRISDARLKVVSRDAFDEGYSLIINGTSAGLSGELIDLPGHIVGTDSCCYDMVYGPGATTFNSWCKEQTTCSVADGLGMLVEQAALAFNIWFDREVQTAPVIANLRSSMKP